MSEARALSEPKVPHDSCEICRTIPEYVSSTSKGDDTWGGPIPAAVGRLEIVGAPLYDGDTSGSNSALHKCPLCGTFYWWEHEYEYLAGGSEDSDSYTRLDPESGAARERECLEQVAAARERARAKADSTAATLLASTDEETVRNAYWSMSDARKWGLTVDLTEAVPALVAKLASLGRDGPPGLLKWYVPDLLRPWVGEDPGRAEEVLRLIASSGVPEPSEEARSFAAHCEEVRARAAATREG